MLLAETQNPGLWELAVLCCLKEDPMHPYEIQRVLKERKKDEVLALKKGSLYHAIGRLLRAGLIDVVKTSRNGRRPERTTYRITPPGEEALVRWLRNLIAQPRHEPSDFVASLNFLVYLGPQDAALQLEARAKELAKQIAGFDWAIEVLTPRVRRINVIETEYARASRRAELAWVRQILAEIRSGRFTWDVDEILEAVRAARAAASGATTSKPASELRSDLERERER
jgi:DNA-binding PadR family transcriptional regulator